MLSGSAQVKAKSIKYIGSGKFELVLTEVEPQDSAELLAFNGDYIRFNFYTTTGKDKEGEIKAEPQTGRLFRSVNGVIEYVDATGEPIEEQEETENQEPGEETEESGEEAGETVGGFPCEKCQNCNGIAKDGEEVLEVDCEASAWGTWEPNTACSQFMQKEDEPEAIPPEEETQSEPERTEEPVTEENDDEKGAA